MDRQEEDRDVKQARFSLSQETITILTVGVALAGLILMNVGETRAEREAMRAEARADRAEARADREAFEKKIIRLVEQQGTLNGLVDGLRHAIPQGGMSRETVPRDP